MSSTDVGVDYNYRARQTQSYTTTYTDGITTIQDCANNVQSALEEAVKHTTNDYLTNMLIAHSQGGIVSRTLNMEVETYSRSRYFGGIAFFDSSHKGARLLNNLAAGAGNDLVNWACPLLTNPLIDMAEFELLNPLTILLPILPGGSPGIPATPILDIFGWDGDANTLVCDAVMESAVRAFEQLGGPHTDSYKVGASHLVDYNSTAILSSLL